MIYPEAIRYLESFINYERIPAYLYKESLRLERIEDFLYGIGNPQDTLNCIHIAGTKGKGSTCAFIAYILREAGYKVGLYTSPHLSDFRERIRVLNCQIVKLSNCQNLKEFEGMISQNELVDLVKRLKPAIDESKTNSKYGPLTFFEAYTALAFEYFKEQKVDFAVLETGMGGRLDATNTVNALVCVITPISYEHTRYLGNTLREIVMEKAGIIKAQSSKAIKAQNLIVVTAPQKKEVIEVIRDRCKEAGAKLYEVDKISDFKIRLLGRHQLVNASVAVRAIEALRESGYKVGVDSIKRGLYNTIWPGRCEVISEKPCVVLDGAQNIASARVLKEAIRENFKYKRLILVLGISSDKDIRGICNELSGLADIIVLTKSANPRAAEVDCLEQAILSLKQDAAIQVIKTKDVDQAKQEAESIAGENDLILVTGSLFVVGEYR